MLALLTLIACGVDEANFAERFAAVSCERGITCEEPGYAGYADEGECLPEALADWEALELAGAELGCPLDYERAADCLAAFRDADCAAIADQSWEAEPPCEALLSCN